jgi:hypothetical protein
VISHCGFDLYLADDLNGQSHQNQREMEKDGSEKQNQTFRANHRCVPKKYIFKCPHLR